MKGGGLLSKQDLACVFRPDIKYDEDSIVSKIDKSTNLNNEISILNKMKEIDPEGRFHSMFVERFPLDSVSIPDEYRKCRHSKEAVIDMGVMNITYVGKKTFFDYLREGNIKTLNDDEVAMIFVRICNVIAGLFHMNLYNIFHNDIHLRNVIIHLDEGTKVPNEYGIKIIDFGMGTLYAPRYSNKNDFDDFFDNLGFAADFFITHEDGKDFDIGCDSCKNKSKILEKPHRDNVDYIKTIKNYLTFLKDTFGERYSTIAYNTYFKDILIWTQGGGAKKISKRRSHKNMQLRVKKRSSRRKQKGGVGNVSTLKRKKSFNLMYNIHP